MSAAATLIAQYDQYYHRLVPGGNVSIHLCRPFWVPPPGPGSHQKFSHVHATDVSALTVFDGFHVSSMNSFVVFFFSCCGVLWLCVLGVTILRKSGYLQSIFTGRI